MTYFFFFLYRSFSAAAAAAAAVIVVPVSVFIFSHFGKLMVMLLAVVLVDRCLASRPLLLMLNCHTVNFCEHSLRVRMHPWMWMCVAERREPPETLIQVNYVWKYGMDGVRRDNEGKCAIVIRHCIANIRSDNQQFRNNIHNKYARIKVLKYAMREDSQLTSKDPHSHHVWQLFCVQSTECPTTVVVVICPRSTDHTNCECPSKFVSSMIISTWDSQQSHGSHYWRWTPCNWEMARENPWIRNEWMSEFSAGILNSLTLISAHISGSYAMNLCALNSRWGAIRRWAPHRQHLPIGF